MVLIERGQLNLDDTVNKWLPRFRPKLASGEPAAITVRELMTHTSGLGYGFSEPPGGPYRRAGVSDGLDQPGLSMRDEIRRLASVRLLHPPGSVWNYSLSIDVLGAVIESVTHKPLSRAVHELVTDPLDLRDTDFKIMDANRLAAAYVNGQPFPTLMTEPQLVRFPPDAPPESNSGLLFSPARAFNPKSFPSGGGGMIGSAPDVMHFLEAIRQGGGKILSPESSYAMMANQIGTLPGVLYGPGWEFGFGGAVLVDPAVAHSPHGRGTWRWGGVYGSLWFVDPTQNLTVVSLTNTTTEGVRGKFVSDLVLAVYK